MRSSKYEMIIPARIKPNEEAPDMAKIRRPKMSVPPLSRYRPISPVASPTCYVLSSSSPFPPSSPPPLPTTPISSEHHSHPHIEIPSQPRMWTHSKESCDATIVQKVDVDILALVVLGYGMGEQRHP